MVPWEYINRDLRYSTPTVFVPAQNDTKTYIFFFLKKRLQTPRCAIYMQCSAGDLLTTASSETELGSLLAHRARACLGTYNGRRRIVVRRCAGLRRRRDVLRRGDQPHGCLLWPHLWLRLWRLRCVQQPDYLELRIAYELFSLDILLITKINFSPDCLGRLLDNKDTF